MAKYGSRGRAAARPLRHRLAAAAPDLFSGRHVNVEIETVSDLTRGMTVADWWGVTARPRNATFMGGVDADGFFRPPDRSGIARL